MSQIRSPMREWWIAANTQAYIEAQNNQENVDGMASIIHMIGLNDDDVRQEVERVVIDTMTSETITAEEIKSVTRQLMKFDTCTPVGLRRVNE